MTAETVLLRVKRRGEQWLERPGIRGTARFFGCFAGGLVLSGLQVWGRMQPVAMGFAAACTGWRSLAAAAGGSLGYVLFFGEEGFQGSIWMLGALLLALVIPLVEKGERVRFHLAAGCMVVVAGTWVSFGASQEAALLFLLSLIHI